MASTGSPASIKASASSNTRHKRRQVHRRIDRVFNGVHFHLQVIDASATDIKTGSEAAR
jgi:hypothetical protein